MILYWEKNILYQIALSSNHINNKYNNISKINLDESENKLEIIKNNGPIFILFW